MYQTYSIEYGVYPWTVYSLAMVTPVPEPPNTLSMATPLPHPPTMPVAVFTVPNPSWAMGTPMPIPPSTAIFLGPQQEPPDKALKRNKEYLLRLKESVSDYSKQIEEALSSIDEQLTKHNNAKAKR